MTLLTSVDITIEQLELENMGIAMTVSNSIKIG